MKDGSPIIYKPLKSAEDAYIRAKEIESLESKLGIMVQNDSSFTKIKDTAIHAIHYLFANPVTSISEMSQGLGRAYNTTQNILNILMQKGLIVENTVHKRNKLYRFEAYLALLEKEYSSICV